MMCGELHVRDSVGADNAIDGGVASCHVLTFGFIPQPHISCFQPVSWVSVGQRIDNDHFVQALL
jgi:hypothetical protein